MDVAEKKSSISWLVVIIPVLFLAGVFFPILGYGFINLDVPGQIIENPDIRELSPGNILHIFTSKNVSSYYPIRTLTLALDYHFWGMIPRGYKLTNLAIHLVNTLLVFWLLRRLLSLAGEAPTCCGVWWTAVLAAFGASIFAIHPVIVEPVVWVPGREELLMTFGTLACFHCHLGARHCEAQGRLGAGMVCRFGAVLCCVIGCLSNAVGAVTPLLITAWDVLTLERPRRWRIVRSTAALWVVGLATIALKRSGAENQSLEVAFFSFTRLLMVFNVLWLDGMALVWPTGLAIGHGKIAPHGLADPGVLLGMVLAIVVLAVLWRFRKRKTVVFGLLWFLIALGPTSQIMPHHIHQADRFLYLPLAGLTLALAAMIQTAVKPPRPAEKRQGKPARNGSPPQAAMAVPTWWIAAATGCLLLLAVRSSVQVRTWKDSVTVWRHALKVAPGNVFAHRQLADAFSESGRFDEAIPHYEWVLEQEPGDTAAITNFAMHLACSHDERLRDYDRAIALARRGCEETGGKEPPLRRVLSLAHMNRATALARAGRFAEAVKGYRSAIDADPQHDAPLFNLALLLGACPDETIRQPEEAVRLAAKACAMTEAAGPVQLSILADIYEQTGHANQAIDTLRRAAQAAHASGEPQWGQDLNRRRQALERRLRENGG